MSNWNKRIELSTGKTLNYYITVLFLRLLLADVVYHPWRKEHEGDQTREIMYTIALNNPLAPKAATVTEAQVGEPELKSFTFMISSF